MRRGPTGARGQPAEALAPFPAPGPRWEPSMFLERGSERLCAGRWMPFFVQRLTSGVTRIQVVDAQMPAGLLPGNPHRGYQ